MALQPPDRIAAPLSVTPLTGMPLFRQGDNIAREVAAALHRRSEQIAGDDVVVVAQKIVSKVEGRTRRLRDVVVSAGAQELAIRAAKPAALIQLIMDESTDILRVTPAVIVTRHKSGHVGANAGIDASNVEGGADDTVLLWPRDPDASARTIRAGIQNLTGVSPAIVIADSLGRAWRLGTVGMAIGSAGLSVVDDRRGEVDLYGRTLQATLVAVADSIAAAAVLAMGEGAEGAPAAIVRGMGRYVGGADSAASGLRPLAEDLFR